MFKSTQNNKNILKIFPHEYSSGTDEHLFTITSHKRSTGQGICGRLYEGLKHDYKVFLDSEAKFKIHNLKEIVKQTENFIFVLTHGILLSYWCLQELEAAVENKKKVRNHLIKRLQIIVVRDISFNLPPILPQEWQKVVDVLQHSDQLIWLAEYNAACIKELKNRIGIPDIDMLPALEREADACKAEKECKFVKNSCTF